MIKNNYSYKNIKSVTFPDLVRVTIQAKVARPHNVGYINGQPSNLESFQFQPEVTFKPLDLDYTTLAEPSDIRRCRLFSKDSSRGSVLRYKKYDIVTVRLRFNGQYELKKMIIDLLGIDKVPNVYWGQGNNYISAQVYELLQSAGIELSELQEQVLFLLAERIRKAYKRMRKDYYNLFRESVKIEKTMIYLKQAEVCTDFVGPIQYEMARDPNFVRQFDEMIHNHKIGFFNKKRKHLIQDPGCETVEGFTTVKQLVGYYHGNIELKTYKKSVDSFGSTNRIESKFSSKALDQVLYLGRWLSEDDSMPLFAVSDRIRKLIKIHSQMTIAVLKYKPISSRPKYKKQIKLAVRNNCGKYSREILKIYLKWRKIYTGKGTPLSMQASAKVRKLCRDGILFKKSKKHKASYFISRNYLNEYYGQF